MIWARVFSGLLSIAVSAMAAVAPGGLVGHWRFDEGGGTTARDEAGTHHGSLQGVKWAPGVSGTALRFDESGTYAEIGADRSLDLTDALTISAWLQTENFDTPILNKLTYYRPGNYDFRLERSGALSLSHEVEGGRRMSHYQSSARLSAGRWHHVAVTLVVGGDVHFYVDGQAAGSVRQTGTPSLAPDAPLRIGAKPDPYATFRGRIDEVRLYRRALTDREVKELAAEFEPAVARVAAGADLPAAAPFRTTIVSPAVVNRVEPGAEWPQWLGPARDGKSPATGLLRRWPESGPALIWYSEGLGEGYSTVSIAGGRIYTTGMRDQQEEVFALDLHGRLLWRRSYGPAWHGRYSEVRTTPTVDDGRVYVISGMGRVVCFDAAKGDELWAVDAAAEFGAKYDHWGIAESPLIVDRLVVCTPGGTRATFAALDKRTGATVWASPSLGEDTGYCSPICIPRQGRRVIVTMLKKSLVGVDAATGAILWRQPYSDYQTSPHGINPNSPVAHDGSFYTTSGYECGGALHQLDPTGATITRRWTDRVLDCHHGGVVLVNGFLYGSNFKGHYAGNWVCLDWATGAVTYETKWKGKGAITCADGLLYCYEEKEGTVGLVAPSPQKFEVISSFKVPRGTGPHWAHPVVCGGRLYIRHGNALLAYDLKPPP